MRREKRPFLVELKRGQKRPATLDAPAETELKSSSLRRAKAMLFDGDNEAEAMTAAATQAPRRILEAVAEEAPGAPLLEAPRRGRKPGSKNRPKVVVISEEAAPKRARGRPRLHPEGAVRNVSATAELAQAALHSIGKISSGTSKFQVPRGHMHPVPMFEPTPKRKRGRPRKVRPPKFDWSVWTADEKHDGGFEAETADFEVAYTPDPVFKPTPLTFAPQYESTGPRLRAGERWKRRIRVPGGGPLKPRSRVLAE